MLRRIKTWLPIATVLVVLGIGWFIANGPAEEGPGPGSSPATADDGGTPDLSASAVVGRTQSATAASASPATTDRYDLMADEARGGHTIERHVARTENELRARLAREPDISAASTYFDLETAEVVVAAALLKKKAEIDRWSRGSGDRANLALRYTHSANVGITVERGAREARELDSVVVVLRWASADWYVLTSYPDD